MIICFYYRVPSKGNQRGDWIEAIEKHQTFQHSRREYNVCIRHFEPCDVEKKDNKFALKQNAIPTIFKELNENCDEIIGNEFVDDAMQNAKCAQCPFLLAQIDEFLLALIF